MIAVTVVVFVVTNVICQGMHLPLRLLMNVDFGSKCF